MKRSVKVFCGQQALLFGFQPEAHQLSFSNVDQKTRTWCRNCWKEKKGESIFSLNIYQFYQSLWKPCEILAKSFLNIYQFPESSWKFISFLNPREILVKSCLNIYQFPKSLWKFTTFLNPCEIFPQYLPVSRILVKIYQFSQFLWNPSSIFTSFQNPRENIPQQLQVSRILVKIYQFPWSLWKPTFLTRCSFLPFSTIPHW